MSTVIQASADTDLEETAAASGSADLALATSSGWRSLAW